MKPPVNRAKLQKTQDHYDRYPYDVGVKKSRVYVSEHSAIGKFIQPIAPPGAVLDIGCGPGNILLQLQGRAGRLVGLDLSRVSLGEARRDAGNDSRIHWIRANALELPFADRSFDFVIAAGSLHHTPDARAGFMEACRVLRPGGRCFVAVYHRKSYYFFVYYTLGWAARLCERRRLSALLINRGIILPLFLVYFLLGRLITHRQFKLPAYAELMNYFADQMLNPVVSFHSSEETSEWARVAGVERTDESYSHAGALLNMQFLRPV